jgi:hypothetical protein
MNGEPEPISASEWETSTDLRRMLWQVREAVTLRQTLLFGCACCRRIWPWFVDPRNRQAIEHVEQWVDSSECEQRRAEAFALAEAAMKPVFDRAYAEGHDVFHPTVYASWAARALTFFRVPWMIALQTAMKCTSTLEETIAEERAGRIKAQEQAWQADLLRDVVGNPFRPIALAPEWVSPPVLDLARSIYTEQEFEQLPALATALTEAGCNNEDLLQHCRSEKPHTRGCWALDLIFEAPLSPSTPAPPK